ncbi:hypothetical protein PHLCEN_2v9703 [Hermanssonia centrifuga]|uniref:Uncharacterized protein n=1 Tax=Hermanssonia centrifuga TaxID=98765 RepID=A0A2R6NPR8_9APHY|nr:hypothetical protein PHLCEN_2v9703 [Hermanssonia centrifuga]
MSGSLTEEPAVVVVLEAKTGSLLKLRNPIEAISERTRGRFQSGVLPPGRTRVESWVVRTTILALVLL